MEKIDSYSYLHPTIKKIFDKDNSRLLTNSKRITLSTQDFHPYFNVYAGFSVFSPVSYKLMQDKQLNHIYNTEIENIQSFMKGKKGYYSIEFLAKIADTRRDTLLTIISQNPNLLQKSDFVDKSNNPVFRAKTKFSGLVDFLLTQIVLSAKDVEIVRQLSK